MSPRSLVLCSLLYCLILCCASLAEAANFTLVYHHVGTPGGVTLGVSPQELEQRVAWFKAHGYTFVNSSQIPDVPEAQRTVTLEFDDGFSDVYHNAFPVLRRLGVPATIYPILDLIGAPGHYTRAQIREMVAAGWEVGSHTRTHASLPDLSSQGIERELQSDGHDACVAYPFSRHDARVRRLTRQHYRCGVAGAFGVHADDPYALLGPKITPWDDALLEYRASTGADLRVPVLIAAQGLAALDRRGQADAWPRFFNPARFELLGSGLQSFEWFGGVRTTDFSLRSGSFVYNSLVTRGDGGLEALGLAWNSYPFTLAAGYSSRGPVAGVALALGNSGDAWLRLDRTWTAGLEIVPLDYLRLKAEVSGERGPAAEAWYALPWNGGEGRPLAVLGGYDGGLYLGVSYRFGSFDVTGLVKPGASSYGVRLASLW